MMADGTWTWNDHDQGTWAFTDINHRIIKFTWTTGAAGASSVMMLSADGQRLEGTDSRGLPMIFTRIGGVPGSTATNPATGNSLEGTTWKGDSSGGDKHYKFQFLSDGVVLFTSKYWIGDDTPLKGTWRQTGNRIDMTFTQLYPRETEATISGDRLTGSMRKYKFSLEKVP